MSRNGNGRPATGATVLHLRTVCPECGGPPRLRAFPAVRAFAALEPEEPLLTYQCHRTLDYGRPTQRVCSCVYPIRAGDFRIAG